MLGLVFQRAASVSSTYEPERNMIIVCYDTGEGSGHDGGYETSGVCGDNITWQVKNGELILNGTGWIWDYDYEDSYRPPWFNVRNSIERVKINEGITNIGDDVFYALLYLKSVSIPRSLNTIDYGAFSNCYCLTDVYYVGSEDE